MHTVRARYPACLAAAACLLSLLVYLPALDAFFANDDWVLLYHYGQMPLVQPWRFFSPEVVWFYRPLQSLQFGVFYRLFGLDPVPYNLALLLMHAGVCVLVYHFARDLGRCPGLAAGTTALFAVQWIYVALLLWKANFNTLQWALLTLATCIAFLRYLRGRQKTWRLASCGLCALSFFAKEAALNMPLLLALVWAFHEGRREDLSPPAWRAAARRAAAELWPYVAMTVAYIVLHRLMVRDVYAAQKPGYFFVGPLQGTFQVLHVYTHSFLAFRADPLLLAQALRLQEFFALVAAPPVPATPVQDLVLANRGAVGLAAGLAWLAWKVRDRQVWFGLAWVLLAFVPCVFLRDYHSSRFYYLPAMGVALVLARLVQLSWAALALRPAPVATLGRIALLTGAGYFAIANLATTAEIIRSDRVDSEQAQAVFELLRSRRAEIPAGALVVLRRPPEAYFRNGLGAREMARFALADSGVEAVMERQEMEPDRLAAVRAIRDVYVVDMTRSPLTLERLRGGTPQTRVSR